MSKSIEESDFYFIGFSRLVMLQKSFNYKNFKRFPYSRLGRTHVDKTPDESQKYFDQLFRPGKVFINIINDSKITPY